MGLIPEPVIEQVLARADILQTVQQYVTLKRAGTNFKGLCPFHNENTPSFNVHPGKGIYKCFGCGKGGNVFDFLMSIEGWSFPETVRQLAERYGVDIPKESPEEAEKSRRRREGKKLYQQIMQAARDYYEAMLWSDAGRAARLYLEERGIGEEVARTFGLGYAPNGWDNLLGHLQGQGLNPALLERAGLVNTRSNGGGHYDRFRHRVVFPIVDIWGHTLAFGGRTLVTDDPKTPKYINSPETSFYTKGDQLYGLDVAKAGIQKAEYALLVEGNFDVIALHAHGFDMTVAPMGTALTETQARLLARYTKRVLVAFDGDSAGEEATLRSLPAFEKAGLEPLVIRFDEYDDPDSFVRRRGAPALKERIEAAQPLVAWALDRILRPADGGAIERKLQALEEASALLSEVHNRVTWEHYAQEVSRRLAIEPRLLRDYLKRPEHFQERARQAVIAASQGAELESAEYGVLVVLLDHPQWVGDFLRDELDNLLGSQELADFLRLLQEHFQTHGELKAPLLLEKLDHGPMRRTVEDALADIGRLYQEDKSLRWYQDCVRTLKRGWAHRTLEHLMAELEQVDFRSQRDRYEELHQQLNQINRFKAALDQEMRRSS